MRRFTGILIIVLFVIVFIDTMKMKRMRDDFPKSIDSNSVK